MDDRTRWTDDRLDDRFVHLDERVNDVTHEVHALRNLPNAVSELAVEVREARSDVDHGFESMRDLSQKLDLHVTERREKDEQHRVERKSDRRFLVTTMLTAVGIVIAGVALLMNHL